MKIRMVFAVGMVLLLGITLAAVGGPKTVEEYTRVSEKETSLDSENFDRMMDVITHPRCMNCHPNDNVPKQGDDSHPHYFNMARGSNNLGFEATRCTTCHQSENNSYSGVPGAPHWSLAPASMGWQGLTRDEIAKRLLNPEANGNRSYEDLISHMTEDALVKWAWSPGVDANGVERTPPPVSHEEFSEAVTLWFAGGAQIPEE